MKRPFLPIMTALATIVPCGIIVCVAATLCAGAGELVSAKSPVFAPMVAAATPPSHAACSDPTTCNPVRSIRANWRCDIPGCIDKDWMGGAVSWPSWAADANNARRGTNSRTVYATTGEKLYPYMRSWASGCRVISVEGTVLIIEWQRGTDVWRETRLQPGESHVIRLSSPEDSAMLETPSTPTDFVVSLENCTPRR